MIYKFRYRTLGGHVHVAVFIAAAANHTFAKSGDLVFKVGPDFDGFERLLRVGDPNAVILEEVAR